MTRDELENARGEKYGRTLKTRGVTFAFEPHDVGQSKAGGGLLLRGTDANGNRLGVRGLVKKGDPG